MKLVYIATMNVQVLRVILNEVDVFGEVRKLKAYSCVAMLDFLSASSDTLLDDLIFNKTFASNHLDTLPSLRAVFSALARLSC